MRVGRKPIAVGLVSALVVATLLYIQAGSILSRFGLPGSANLTEVETRLTPALAAELSEKGLQLGAAVFMRVFKEQRELEVWVKAGAHFKHFKTYEICTYSGDLGPKLKEGDRQSPEGFYRVTPAQMNPNSNYHLSFNIGFPNAFDRSHQRTGSFLMVHGHCVSIGCYAMTNSGIEEIYLLANETFKEGKNHFDIHIFPFRMTEANLKRYSRSPWYAFWNDLKLGHDAFEHAFVPPNIVVRDGRYRIEAE
ncbi:L,D-transpeptidase family protein [Roseibium sp.]|uniref:L,D-transpeptidase family protein n=1 Tax=Roseibium sp. TaxID=1936156 RepID=UPI003BA902E1